jgi:hypothetical protein
MDNDRITSAIIFSEELMKVLRQKAGDGCCVERRRNVGINDVVRYSVNLLRKGKNSSINFYVDSLFSEYQKGIALNELADYIIWKEKESDISCFQNFTQLERWSYSDMVRDGRIIAKLVNRKKNKFFLKDKCYIPFLDLAIVFYVLLYEDKTGMESTALPIAVLEQWNISREQLLEDALVTMEKRFPVVTKSLYQLMLDEKEEDAGEYEFIFILTNKNNCNGAVTILYRDALKHFAQEKQVQEVFILPSSLHEVMLVPRYFDCWSGKELKEMVEEINQMEVPVGEVLSDNIYVYDLTADEIRLWDGKEN